MSFTTIPGYQWKAGVATVADLPPIGNSVGDVRTIVSPLGAKQWDGSAWVDFGGGGGGSGNVTGPVSSTDSAIVCFDGTTGELIKQPNAKIQITDSLTSISGNKVIAVKNITTSDNGIEIGQGYWTYGSQGETAIFVRGKADPTNNFVEISTDDVSTNGRLRFFYLGNMNTCYQQSLLNGQGFKNQIATVSGEHRFDFYIRGASVSRTGQTDVIYNNNGGSDVTLWTFGTEGTFFSRQVGKGISIQQGSGTLAGTATLVAGTVTVTNANVTADSKIFLQASPIGGTAGFLEVVKNAGVGFTINSTSASDTSTIDYFIVQTHT
jgi:hypothetical protein